MKKKFTLTKEQIEVYKSSKYSFRIALEALVGVVALGFSVASAIMSPAPELWQTFLASGAPLTLHSICRFIKKYKVCKAIENDEVQIKK